MQEQLNQILTYVRQAAASGLPEATIRQQLSQAGWSLTAIDQAFSMLASPQAETLSSASPLSTSLRPTVTNPHKKNSSRRGVLWICSPYIVIIGAIIINIILRAIGLRSPVFNVISLLAGVAGVILVPVGTIIGIVILSRSKTQ